MSQVKRVREKTQPLSHRNEQGTKSVGLPKKEWVLVQQKDTRRKETDFSEIECVFVPKEILPRRDWVGFRSN